MDRLELAGQRGEQALQVLNNPLFMRAFTDTRQAILEAWAALPSSDERRSEYSHDLHRMLKCLEKVEKCIKEHVTTGKLAAREIEGKKNIFGRMR